MNPRIQSMLEQIDAYCGEHFRFGFDPANPIVRLHEPGFGAAEIGAMLTQALSTYVTMGEQVKRFEAACGQRFESPHTIMSNSGSSANLLAVAALANPAWPDRLQPGDEVLVPALSWATTVWPLVQHQLVPVFLDCDPATLNFDAAVLEAAITPRTRAIMLVHVYGNPCPMDAVMALAKRHNLYVIEDCCEAMGATFKGKQVGSFGDAGTMSLYYSHHITTFEGGLSFTPHFALAELMRILRAHGWSREAEEKAKYIEQYPDIDPRFIFINQGYNFRPTEVQAAMGQAQLLKLDAYIATRRKAHADYRERLARYSEFFRFQDETPHGQASWFGFTFTLKPAAPFTREELTAFLQSRHIETRPVIAGNMARHPALGYFPHRSHGRLEHCDRLMKHALAIGCHHFVDEAACDYVADVMLEFMKRW